MCGIVGFLNKFDQDRTMNILQRMMTRIVHRGPDESGIYVSDRIGLGSVRLSIQDIHSGGMPISTSSENLWIVFNGEVYNFIELRQDLIKKGHKFKTSGDTEVVVHMYEEYGIDFLSKLNGQFALAIWDHIKKELILARDRVGIRPLFYFQRDSEFVFASEIKALLEYPGLDFSIRKQSLCQYFTFWSSLENHTIFSDIEEVPPGFYFKISEKGIYKNRYWDIPLYPDDLKSSYSLQQSLEEFEEIMRDSIRLRLRADVPVGAYLSGGLDSTLTTSFIKDYNSEILNTFSIGFSDSEFDETSYQRIASQHFQTNHSYYRVKDEDISKNFMNAILHAESPLLRTSPIPMYLLSKKVRDSKIKVVITGEGADELFGGYNIFKEAKIRQFWAKDKDSRLRPLLLKRLYPYLPFFRGQNANALKLFFGYKLEQTDSLIYSHLLRWKNTSRITNYFSKEVVSELGLYDPVVDFESKLDEELNSLDYLGKASYIEIKQFLSGYLLSSQGDRMAMANSVEGRYPFLDHRLIDFAMRLPSDFKLKGLNEKYILKKAAEKRNFPKAILERSKQAYRAPIDQILWGGGFQNRFSDFLGKKMIDETGLFDETAVSKLLTKFDNRGQVSETDRMALTGILSSQILYDYFVNQNFPPLEDKDLIRIDKITFQN